MQLIQRKTLVYQAGSSDKVYEVDLCQLAEDRYVVNYRFGRRGAQRRRSWPRCRPGTRLVASGGLSDTS